MYAFLHPALAQTRERERDRETDRETDRQTLYTRSWPKTSSLRQSPERECHLLYYSYLPSAVCLRERLITIILFTLHRPCSFLLPLCNPLTHILPSPGTSEARQPTTASPRPTQRTCISSITSSGFFASPPTNQKRVRNELLGSGACEARELATALSRHFGSSIDLCY